MNKQKLTPTLNGYYLYNSLKKCIDQIEGGYSDDYRKFYKEVEHQVKMYEDRRKRIGEME